MIFEEMTIRDYPEIYALWDKTPGIGLSESDSRENIEAFLIANPGLNFICRDDKQSSSPIIATALCGCDQRRAYLYHVLVDENYRGRGIGQHIVGMCLSQLKKMKIMRCHLFVFKDNLKGIGFWENTGWRLRKDILVFTQDIL